MDKAQALKLLGRKKYRVYDTIEKRMFIFLENIDKDKIRVTSTLNNKEEVIENSAFIQYMELVTMDNNNEEVYELDIIKSEKFSSPLIVSSYDSNEFNAQFLKTEENHEEGDSISFEMLGSFTKLGTVYEIKKIMAMTENLVKQNG